MNPVRQAELDRRVHNALDPHPDDCP
jgi:hypothetical protein